ncbi:DUF5986 family protein [Peribacillus sp. NPDC006672]|uniref:DUF5986 family protein n=1 Tax=Peribacillus sp. NPDC006672 TaxID=3390606 RepID=UPI003D0051F1
MNELKFAESGIIRKVVRAFSDNLVLDVQEVRKLLELKKFNSKYALAWDIRYSRIEDLDGDNNIVALTSRRGFWGFSMLLNIESGTLFVFTKEKNLDEVIKRFGKEKLHYIHSLLFLNKKYDEDFGLMHEDFQLSLQIDGIEEFDAQRKLDAINILGDYYSDINKVILVTLTEENNVAVKVEAGLFTSDCQLIDKEDWSSFIRPAFNDREVDSEEIEKENASKKQTEKSIPVLKPQYSNSSRNGKEKRIVAKRKHTIEKNKE